MPSELANTVEALKHVDVISPNHVEIAALYDVSVVNATGELAADAIQTCAQRLLASADGSNQRLHVVVRCGRDGCYISERTPGREWWIPAYHASSQQKVIDPTGGGNGFLGGFAVGLVRTQNVVKATIWGSVSASLCIEVVGVPVMGKDQDGHETWNGVDVTERLEEFSDHCGG